MVQVYAHIRMNMQYIPRGRPPAAGSLAPWTAPRRWPTPDPCRSGWTTPAHPSRPRPWSGPGGPISSSSAAATPGCGRPSWPRRRPVARRRPRGGRPLRLGGSGRNGGFCTASLTHGLANGMERFPGRWRPARAARRGRTSTPSSRPSPTSGIDCDFERTGELDVATEPYQVDGLREAEAWARAHGARRSSSTGGAAGRDPLPDLPGRPVGRAVLRPGPSGPAGLGSAAGAARPPGCGCSSTAGWTGSDPTGPGPAPPWSSAPPRPGHRGTGWCWPPTHRPRRSGDCASTSCRSTTTC